MCDESATQLYWCQHGTYHFSIAGLTLHLSPRQLDDIRVLLGTLLKQNGEQFFQDCTEQNETTLPTHSRFSMN